MRSVELFTGAGGLAIGVSYAGFRHDAVIERNTDCCNTIRMNQSLGVDHVVDWVLHESDVSTFSFNSIKGDIDLLAGGPPCQPFSLGGKHQGYRDARNMFPHVIRAVRELKPRAILVENVKGLLRESFAHYFEYINLQLTYPEITRKDEDWRDHLSRLEQHHTGYHSEGLSYRVVYRLLNAADYGVPQRRERVFIVGFRSDIDVNWSFPNKTYSREALLWNQWVTGDYWEQHEIAIKDRPEIPAKLKSYLEKPQQPIEQEAWKTVRDAIEDLPEPETRANSSMPNHQLNPGARSYPGHTGSLLDAPAKTLKAGDHGVPGGENMLAYPDGRVRYFTVREAARLQTFPDSYVFPGSWTETMRQLGNAVPVSLAKSVATGIYERLEQL